MVLPKMPYRDKLTKTTQVRFGGLHHKEGASDGDLYDMENLTSRDYPVLSTREAREKLYDLAGGNGLFADGDDLYFCVHGVFYKNGEKVGAVSDTEKEMAKVGGKIVIMPDKRYYDTVTGVLASLEAEVTGAAIFEDGTIYGEGAAANTVRMTGVDFAAYFTVGDGVMIEGGSYVIREIDGDRLRFDENSFSTGTREVSIARRIPDLSHICEHENRLWGCAGRTIFASKLGDPKNFYVFDGISTDAYSVELSFPGAFTACTSFGGYPMFFAEDCLFKMYGTRPTNFSTARYDTLGVKEGAASSLAIAGETLFYISRAGVCAWNGSRAEVISDCFGAPATAGTGGSDGLNYYVSQDGMVYVWDTMRRLWMKEDALHPLRFAFHDGRLLASTPDGIFAMSGGESPVRGCVVFGDMTMESPDKKHIAKIQLRIQAARFRVFISYDGGEWQQLYRAAGEDRSYLLPFIPRRCDRFRLMVTGEDFKIYALSVTYADGGER